MLRDCVFAFAIKVKREVIEICLASQSVLCRERPFWILLFSGSLGIKDRAVMTEFCKLLGFHIGNVGQELI